jgi:hypothetical protein
MKLSSAIMKLLLVFSVKYAYNLLQELLVKDQCDEGNCNAYKKLWKCSAPSNFVIHEWRVLLNRIATKEQLYTKCIINEDSILCVFCMYDVESCKHVLFL